jgi:hypothetical protein
VTGTVSSYSVSPALPAGLTLDTASGTISGTPTATKWIWTYLSALPNPPLDVYAIGSETPTFTAIADSLAMAIPSGNSIGLLDVGTGHVSVINLSGSTPSQADYSDPIAYLIAFGADGSTHWLIGNQHGAVVNGPSLSTTPRYLGYGQAWSIAGSSAHAAVSTASSTIQVFDPSVPSLEQTIGFSSSKLALSSDGTVLGAAANANDAQYKTDRTLNFYSLPSAAIIKSYPYALQETQPMLLDFNLAASGATIAQVTEILQTRLYTGEVTPLSGGTAIWSESTVGFPGLGPVLVSPDGTLIALPSGIPGPSSATNIFKNGKLVTAVAGLGIGWIDNSRILVNQYTLLGTLAQYAGAVIYDTRGARIGAPALPELRAIQTVTPDSIYDPSHNAIYSLTTGQPTWTGSLPASGVGAVAGSHVVYESGHRIVDESY